MIADVDVHRATDNLQGPVTGVNGHQADSVGAFNRTNLVDSRHDHVLETLAHELDAVDDQSEVV